MSDVNRLFIRHYYHYLLLLFLLFPSVSYSQLWKKYSDSSKYFEQKTLSKAISYALKADQVLLKDSLPSDTYQANLNYVIQLYYGNNQTGNLEHFLLNHLKIVEEKIGRMNKIFIALNLRLGKLYMETGQFDKTLSYYSVVRGIREQMFGKNHIEYSYSCTAFGLYYHEIGKFDSSESNYQLAKDIVLSVKGIESVDYGTICNNMAILYTDIGDYEKAEYYNLEARRIFEKVYGRNSSIFAINSFNLGFLYYSMGMLAKSISYHEESLVIRKKTVGVNHVDYAESCNGLAVSYLDLGEYKKAEGYLLTALKIWSTAYGRESRDVANIYLNLAILYQGLNDFKKAEYYSKVSRNIIKKIFNDEHTDFAEASEEVGAVYVSMHQYEKAIPFYSEANRIYQKFLGTDHLSYIQNCRNLGTIYWALHNRAKAGEYYSSAFSSQLKNLYSVFQFTSEKEKNEFLNYARINNAFFLSYCLANHKASTDSFAYMVSMDSRNLISTSVRRLREFGETIEDSAQKDLYLQWLKAKGDLSFWLTQPIADRKDIDKQLEAKAAKLEKELVKAAVKFQTTQVEHTSLSQIQSTLGPGEASIEFCEFSNYDWGEWTNKIYYGAIILRKNYPAQFTFLFEKASIDSLLSYQLGSPGESRIDALYTVSANQPLNKLYNILWRPLESKLVGIHTIYFAPAGILYKVSFAAIPIDDTELLSDRYHLVELSSTSKVIDTLSRRVSIAPTDGISIYGGIDYDADSSTLLKAIATLPRNLSKARGDSSPLSSTRYEFEYLSGTSDEADSISALAKGSHYFCNVRKRADATEESVKILSGNNSPAFLHFATHGFFYPDIKDAKKSRKGGEDVFRQSEDPLIRSGLALSGANNAWKGSPIVGVEDGILTAYEVTNLYLPNTKLVVLSACETGLGDVKGSEGVYGLQRAFKIAGVQNLIMSLWKVPDEATVEFMTAFYKELFSHSTIVNAFENAQLQMKTKYRTEPYKWAAWVLVR
jgi:CHAT domain-containing protein